MTVSELTHVVKQLEKFPEDTCCCRVKVAGNIVMAALNSSLAHISNMSLDFLLFVHGRPSILLIFFFFGGVVDIACIDTVGFNLTFTS